MKILQSLSSALMLLVALWGLAAGKLFSSIIYIGLAVILLSLRKCCHE